MTVLVWRRWSTAMQQKISPPVHREQYATSCGKMADEMQNAAAPAPRMFFPMENSVYINVNSEKFPLNGASKDSAENPVDGAPENHKKGNDNGHGAGEHYDR